MSSFEDRKETKTFYIKRMCECGGEMISTGSAYMSYPAKYSHRCDKCQKEETFLKKYPCIEYGDK